RSSRPRRSCDASTCRPARTATAGIRRRPAGQTRRARASRRTGRALSWSWSPAFDAVHNDTPAANRKSALRPPPAPRKGGTVPLFSGAGAKRGTVPLLGASAAFELGGDGGDRLVGAGEADVRAVQLDRAVAFAGEAAGAARGD